MSVLYTDLCSAAGCLANRRVRWREGRGGGGGFAGSGLARLGGRTPIIIITGTGLYGFCHELTRTGPFSDPIIGHATVFLYTRRAFKLLQCY